MTSARVTGLISSVGACDEGGREVSMGMECGTIDTVLLSCSLVSSSSESFPSSSVLSSIGVATIISGPTRCSDERKGRRISDLHSAMR